MDKTVSDILKLVQADPNLSAEFKAALDAKPGPRDPVSGLVPRFTPSTPLPEGAVLVHQKYEQDDYWIPKGIRHFVHGSAEADSTWSGEDWNMDARALGLPLAGTDLAEGEEFWSDGRLKIHYPNVDEPKLACCIGLAFGVQNDRRWDKGAIHGWICKRITPAPGPIALGEWRGWKLTFWPDVKTAWAYKDKAFEFTVGESLLDYPVEAVNALLIAYRRAVVAKLATIPAGWEWLMDEMPERGHDPWVFLGWMPGNSPTHGGAFCRWPTYNETGDQQAESRRRAAMLGLCEAPSAPFGVCLNHGCVSQHDDKCFDDGSHFDPARCTSRVKAKPASVALFCRRWGRCDSLAKTEAQPCCGCSDYEPDQPEEDIEARLTEAGADYVSDRRAEVFVHRRAAFYDNNAVNLCLYGLTPDRAVAALRSAQGQEADKIVYLMEETVRAKNRQLAVANAEVERLNGILATPLDVLITNGEPRRGAHA